MDHRIITKKLQILQGLATDQSWPVAKWTARTADHLGPDEYRHDRGENAVHPPARYPAGKTVFLHSRFTVPAAVRLADAYLRFDFQDMEGLLSIDGRPYAGLDWAHARTPLRRRGTLELAIEFMAVPSIYHDPAAATRAGVFSGATLCVVHRLIEAYGIDVRFAFEAARIVTDPRRKALIEDALEASLLAVDLTLPRDRLLAEVAAARRILHRKLAAVGPDPEAGRIYAVGHTHIDTAWLWPLRETVRKCGRTFSTACRLMEQYPDFHFTCSQPQLYAYTQRHYPDLYRQIKAWVKRGRWETAGAMWVEADCNVTSGESLVRQMLYGLDFFRREFGTRPRMCWLPDVFGYPSSLPGILAGCGVKYFYTYKLHWQAANRFPYSLFRWRSLDGTEVLAHVVNHVGAYNNYTSPEHFFKGWEMHPQKAEVPEIIFPFGFGDGGGGVCEDQMELLHRAEAPFPGLPAVRHGTAERFFRDAERLLPGLPVWDGELYVETHRGTYTTQSAMKRANRKSELLLRDAEILGALAAQTEGTRFSAKVLREAWEQTLVHQFHDILPGSSIGLVYAEALKTHAAVQEIARRSIARSLAALVPESPRRPAVCLGVVNTLGWARQDVFVTEVAAPPDARSVIAPDGTRHPLQTIKAPGGGPGLVFHGGPVPSLGYAVFRFSNEDAATMTLRVSERTLENRFFRVRLDRAGGIRSLVDKRSRRELIAPEGTGNDLQLLQDGPEGEDAWNVHPTIDKRRYPFEGETTLRVVEKGPVRGVLRVRRRHRASTIEQDIVIYAELPRIDFVTRVDWQARHTMLKVAFPLAIRATRATYEVQFGAYERPTHRNTSWDQQKFEVPAQRWADLSEAGYGVSLLNDSRYAYDARENVLRLTLLRSTIFPDPEADRGRHEFTYALYPHAGGWTDAETVRRALELNVPARVRAAAAAECAELPRSFVSVDGVPAVIEALKPAEDGRGLILRLYEPHGGRGPCRVHLGFPVKRVLACNLVEEDGPPVPVRNGVVRFELRPFQVRTFRLLMR